ncbi:MAG: cytochrome c [Steroidobacter sp.]|nr:cytochrome c [Steroidobacter sp.]MBL8268140.1 cytochrome c [Steroidobacter sp.]
MATPFGNLYVPNITADDETGIGLWTADEFYRMMHTGVSRDGTLLYPAMPFANYTNVTREDSDAIYAYLMSVTPVVRENRPHELRFPFNQRELLIGWRTLYFQEGEYVPDPKQSAQWNRGAYLVKGLGHCSMCHTAVNALGGSRESRAFEGGMIPNQNWYAPSLTSNREAGLGNWDLQDIADLLQVGASKRGAVYGPMAEVVYNSLQYLTDEDAIAMADYLKSLPPRDSDPPPPSQARLVDPSVMELGRETYDQQCAVCHGKDGEGYPPAFPPLAGNQSITMSSPVNSIRMVLNGGYAPGTKKNPRPHGMPPFSHILNDQAVAAVVTYIRVAWNNSGTPVTPDQANELRKLLPE